MDLGAEACALQALADIVHTLDQQLEVDNSGVDIVDDHNADLVEVHEVGSPVVVHLALEGRTSASLQGATAAVVHKQAEIAVEVDLQVLAADH